MFAPVLATVPQFVPLQPEPVTLHVTFWFVLKQTFAVKACCAPNPKLAVAGETETAGEHEAVIVTDAVADCEGSATLVATIEIVGEEGTADGAVYVAVFPFVASVPQAEGHALPVKPQFTATLGLPDPLTCAVNAWLAPVATETLDGAIDTCTSLFSVTAAVSLAVPSAWLVALIVMEVEEGRSEGAV